MVGLNEDFALEFTPLEFETAKGGFYDPAGSFD